MPALTPTRRLLAARTAFQEFGRMPKKRDPDYIKPSQAVNSFKDMFSGYLFPMSTFTMTKPMSLKQGEPNMLHWYSTKGMRLHEKKVSKYQEWYREALGTVQYMDGFEYPELQDADSLLKVDEEEREWGAIPVVGEGRGAEFAGKVRDLASNPKRCKKDVEDLIANYVSWSDPTVARYDTSTAADVLRAQPLVLYETLLLLCAESQDWINTTALIREMGHRSIPLRSKVAAALFSYIPTPQMALNLFEVLKKENVKLHLHTYQAMLRVFDRVEEEEQGLAMKAQWEETGEVTGEMMDFVLNGSADALFPESAGYLNTVSGVDPKEEVEGVIAELLRTDRERISA